jgi:Domain of unknown function (DUF6894)
MPRYFFHIRSNGHGRSIDDLGLCFTNVEAASTEAMRKAQGLKSVFDARGEDPREHAIEIENEAGGVVFVMSFADIFDRAESPDGADFRETRDRKEA